MKTQITNSASAFTTSEMSDSMTNKLSVSRFFMYAMELIVLFFLVFATVSVFAQSRNTEPGKLQFTKQTAVFNSGKVYINWVAKENSPDCIYVIERSTDGTEYEPVGLKEGISSPLELLYSWVDAKPVAGTVHYRIQEINNDGNVVAFADAQDVTTPELNPLFIDKGTKMVMVK